MGGGNLRRSYSSSRVSSASGDSPSVYNFSSDFSDFHCKDAILEASERQRLKVYDEIIRKYENLQSRIERFEEAKSKVVSYTPGSRIPKTGGVCSSSDYRLPETTSVILVGPKGSGKSSLVNKISAVLEDDAFGYGPAQVSYNSLGGDGTYFLHEYMIPRNSECFCIYDTRSLSDDSSENEKMLTRWMTAGVSSGAVVRRDSDDSDLLARLRAKARKKSCSTMLREVNFVIFVVNAIDILKAMASEEDSQKQYREVLASAFNNPFLSFQDDKPVVVVTHGDLQSVTDRAKTRIYLGEILHVHPARQIFDIPEGNNGNDWSIMMTTVDMLNYCLERADRNFPCKGDSRGWDTSVCLVVMVLMFAFFEFFNSGVLKYMSPSSDL